MKIIVGICHKSSKFLKTLRLEFSCIAAWFTDRNSKPLEIEVKINITLVVG